MIDNFADVVPEPSDYIGSEAGLRRRGKDQSTFFNMPIMSGSPADLEPFVAKILEEVRDGLAHRPERRC